MVLLASEFVMKDLGPLSYFLALLSPNLKVGFSSFIVLILVTLLLEQA